MVYSTINAVGAISNNPTASAEIVTATKSASGAVTKNVTVTASVSSMAIDASADVSGQAIDATASIDVQILSGDYPVYSGATEVTPTTSTQTLSTASTILTSDIVISPIPSNYGLITWNGSTLTVS